MAAEGMHKQISREKNCDGDQILSSKHRSTKTKKSQIIQQYLGEL